MEVVNERLTYVGGRIDYVDHVDVDRLSLLELDKIVEKNLGYSAIPMYYISGTLWVVLCPGL